MPHWQKQLYMGQGAVAILDFCKLQIPASTFSTTGHVPRRLQWQDNECHHSHKRHLLTCVPGAELLSHTRGIPAMQYPAPWLMAVQEENIPQNLAYLLLCSCFNWLYAP